MLPSPPASHEAARLAALQRYEILDTAPEAAFDEVTALVAESLDVPVALVSLIDVDRQWFKSRVGLEQTQTPRDISFCGHTILQDGVFEIPDAAQDDRFHDNPLVLGEPNIRFYAGAPLLTTDGHRIGTLCVIDRRSRRLEAGQRALLQQFARLLVAQLDQRLANRRLAAERQHLQQRQDYLQQVLNTSLEGLVAIDRAGRITEFNAAAAACLGYSAKQAIGASAIDLLVPTRCRAVFADQVAAFWADTQAAPGVRREIPVLRANGTEVSVEASISLLPSEQGGRIIIFFRDIDEHKKAERLHHQLRDLVEAFPESFIYYDANERLVTANAQVLQKLGVVSRVRNIGRSFEEILAATVREGIYADAVGREAAWIEERMEIHRSYGSMEIRLTNGNWMKLVQRRTADGGRICVYIDITEIKQREAALQAARQEAADASRAKTDFLATMSHEIRTPLNALIGLTEVLTVTPLDTQQRLYLETMQTSGRQLLQIVNDVLDFSRLQADQIQLAEDDIDLRSLLRSLMQTIAALPGAAALRLDKDIAPNVPPRIRGDGSRLTQILTNLMGNAVKFAAGGLVTLSVRAIDTPPGGGALRFEVRDSGPGIPAELKDRIFEHFVQGAGGPRVSRTGTGLGLAIARRLAVAMQGTLELANPGEPGARFVLKMPCRASSSSSTAAFAEPSMPKPASPPRRILVAEDTPASQMVVRLLLEGLGHTVEVVSNGRQAVEACERPFDAVLLDIQMPEMDGCAAAHAIRAREATDGNAGEGGSRLPLVALSAFSQPSEQAAALAAGMDAYLTKPVRRADLVRLFEKLDSLGLDNRLT
jgi:PAS domain S-box-containing protein